MARKIAEFPTLYRCSDDVILGCLICGMGGSFWNEKGVIEQSDKCWNSKTKKWVNYPLQIPLSVAADFINDNTNLISAPHSISGPINHIPLNADKSWLQAISVFLFRFQKLSLDDWQLLAKAKCLIHYGVIENPHANQPKRTFENYQAFAEKIPFWYAAIREVEYYQHNGKIDPKVYQGMDI